MQQVPLILALSGSSKNVDVCLTNGDKLVAQLSIQGTSASRMLVCTVDELLKKAGVTLAQISLITVNVGPGSFTSTRVVVVVANSIAWATKIPILSLTSFDLLFQKYNHANIPICKKSFYVCALDAYSSQVYTGVFDSDGNLQSKQMCLTATKFYDSIKSEFHSKDLVWLLDGVSLPKQEQSVFLAQDYTECDSFALACLAYKRFLSGAKVESKVSVNYVKDGFYNKV